MRMTLANKLMRPMRVGTASRHRGQDGSTLVSVMVAGAIFAVTMTGVYQGLTRYYAAQRDLRAGSKPSDLDSFLRTRVWTKASEYTAILCDPSRFSEKFPALWSVGPHGFATLTKNPVHQNVAEQNAAASRCSNANVPTGPNGNSLYFCFQFTANGGNPPPRDSIFSKLGTSASDNTAFAEVWIGLRNATNLADNHTTCGMFGAPTNPGNVAIIAYSVYYSQQNAGMAGGWSHKKTDRVIYAARSY